MTFGDLLTLVRREIIVDQYEDAFTNAAILDALWSASVEIAAAFDFPIAISVPTVTAGATSIPLSGCRKVRSLSINGDDAVSVDLQELMRYRRGGNRPVKHFNYDPRRGTNIEISPPSQGGTAVIEYTKTLVRVLGQDEFMASEPWDGVLEEFHAVIAYRAGLALFQMDERENETQHLLGEYQNRSSELAAFLGRTDVGNLIVEPALRNDEGAAG